MTSSRRFEVSTGLSSLIFDTKAESAKADHGIGAYKALYIMARDQNYDIFFFGMQVRKTDILRYYAVKMASRS